MRFVIDASPQVEKGDRLMTGDATLSYVGGQGALYVLISAADMGHEVARADVAHPLC